MPPRVIHNDGESPQVKKVIKKRLKTDRPTSKEFQKRFTELDNKTDIMAFQRFNSSSKMLFSNRGVQIVILKIGSMTYFTLI